MSHLTAAKRLQSFHRPWLTYQECLRRRTSRFMRFQVSVDKRI
jgi:hypothetical protein